MEESRMPKFGVARKYARDLPRYINMLHQNNIDAYEMGFAYGIPSDLSDEVIEISKVNNVNLTCHLPFWINLGNSNDEKNLNYLLSGLKIAEKLRSISVLHLGFYGGRKFSEIKNKIIFLFQKILDISEIKNGKLGLEITGKQTAIGTLDEIIEITQLLDDNRIIPVIDWSHLYARNNGIYPYTYQDFVELLEKIEKKIGYKPSYFHGGGIEYKNGNEVKHITLKRYEPPLPYLFAAFHNLGYRDFTFIVESPDSIEDVKLLRQIWQSPEDFFDLIPSKKAKDLFGFGVK